MTMHDADQPSTPPTQAAAPPDESNDRHLRILSVLFFVKAGLMLLGSCGVGIYAIVGGAMMFGAEKIAESDEKFSSGGVMTVGAVMIVIFGALLILQLTLAVLDLVTGMHLHKRRGRTLCMVAAGIACLAIPIGTALGVYTFIILGRPEVKRLFEEQSPVPDS